jgi:hypothetical protein
MAKKALPPDVEARVEQRLRQTDWMTKYPKFADRMTEYRKAREQITTLVLAEEATKQARETAKAAKEAQADLARWGVGGSR